MSGDGSPQIKPLDLGGYYVPEDPMDALQCDSCQ